jgi:hypothetical protein
MLTLEANYSKKIGLPQYSSHQFSLTIRSELSDVRQVEAETTRLYSLLQSSVDREIQEVGFLPDGKNIRQTSPTNGNHQNGHAHPNWTDAWKCTVAQKDLILKIGGENDVSESELNAIAIQRFEGLAVPMLNTTQASGFIKDLLDRYPSKNGNGHGRPPKAGWRQQPR